MLSPSIYTVNDLLAKGLNEMLQLDNYSLTCTSLRIGKLANDPSWLAPVRSRVAMLSKEGFNWSASKPDIWSAILLQFSSYSTAISGLDAMQTSPGITKSEQWVQLLSTVLLPQLDKAIAATTTANNALTTRRNAFHDIQPLLEASINDGWSALADEEQQMVAIAAQLQKLLDLVNSLEDTVTSAEISTGQSVVSTTVNILYNVATSVTESFSFIGMGLAAITVGKYYYDVITNTEEAAKTLQEIGNLQVQASEEAQAAAGTKMVLQLLYGIELKFASIADTIPALILIWQQEREKVQAAIDALNAGADPGSYIDLITLDAATLDWQQIGSFALSIAGLNKKAGPPVTLNPQQNSLKQIVTQ